MNKVNFKVDDYTYEVDIDELASDSFTVRSCPRPYQVSWFQRIEDIISTISDALTASKSNFLLVDANVYRIYLEDANIPPDQVFKMDAVESKKNLDTVCLVIDALERLHPSKNNVLMVVGGGITQDIGAFAACIYKRGLPWQFYPTTLLSMCDSCIGGKTGINYRDGKNQLALFSAPRSVTICPEFLKTLDDREIHSGYGEILKLLVTGGADFISAYTNALDPSTGIPTFANLKKLVFYALGIKRAIVEDDEFELNRRRSLNYGHTLGHALEVMSGYAIPHGQAVALGLMAVNRMAVRRGIFPPGSDAEINRLAIPLIDVANLSLIEYSDLEGLLQRDKKTLTGNYTFVLIKKPGDTIFVHYPKTDETTNKIIDIIREIVNEVTRQ